MPKETILVVDDERLVRWSLQQKLEQWGYHVSLAEDGATALARVQLDNPDLITRDVKLPEMTGIEVLSELRHRNLHVPVIVITAFGVVDDAVRSLKLGAYDFIEKPINFEKLENAIRNALETRRLRTEVAQLQRVLSSPSIDYLAGPQAYEPEALKLGEPYRSRSLIASVRLHGKLWLDEMDCEPTVPIPRDANHDLLLRNSIANVRRNALFTATKGMGLWFYDFGVGGVDLDGFRYNHRGSRGMWDNDSVMAEIARLKRLFEDRMDQEYRSEADVLLVYDTGTFYQTASLRGADPVSSALIDNSSLAAFKSGVIFDPVHIDDLPRVDLSQYRVIVFGNVFVLSI